MRNPPDRQSPRLRRRLAMVAALAMAVGCPPAHAADSPGPRAAEVPARPWWGGWEVRAGAFAHDPSSPERGSLDLSLQALTPPLIAFGNGFEFIVPRLHAGASINFAGKTTVGYAGLAVDFNITKAIFLEGTFGGAVENGYTGSVKRAGRSMVGCNGSFHESGSLGYRIDEHWSVLATIEHSSNAGLCTQNRGITNYGARLAYVF